MTYNDKFNAYLAGPIFTYGDLLRNTKWAHELRMEFPNMKLYSPVENTDINGVEGKKKFADSNMIASGDNARLDTTDVLIACIDGDVIPAGTAAEIGKFHEKIMRGDNKYIIGICTDNRQCHITHSAEKDAGGASAAGEQQYSYHNLYVTGLIKQAGVLVDNMEDVIYWLKVWLDSRNMLSNQSTKDIITNGKSYQWIPEYGQVFTENFVTPDTLNPEDYE